MPELGLTGLGGGGGVLLSARAGSRRRRHGFVQAGFIVQTRLGRFFHGRAPDLPISLGGRRRRRRDVGVSELGVSTSDGTELTVPPVASSVTVALDPPQLVQGRLTTGAGLA